LTDIGLISVLLTTQWDDIH